jgi:hypothetical protein
LPIFFLFIFPINFEEEKNCEERGLVEKGVKLFRYLGNLFTRIRPTLLKHTNQKAQDLFSVFKIKQNKIKYKRGL